MFLPFKRYIHHIRSQQSCPSEGVSEHHSHRELTWIISWWDHFEDTQLAHSELTRWAHTVSLLWAFHEFATLTVRSLLPLHGELTGMISQIAHSKLTMWVANSRKAHSKRTVWVHCEVTECPTIEQFNNKWPVVIAYHIVIFEYTYTTEAMHCILAKSLWDKISCDCAMYLRYHLDHPCSP